MIQINYKQFSSFKSSKKYVSRGREEVKENLNRYFFMNFWKRTKEGIANQTNVHRMLGPWHTDTRTNMFFCGENLLENWPTGEVNRHQKFETTKNEKAQRYTRTFIDQNIYSKLTMLYLGKIWKRLLIVFLNQ